MLPRQRAVRKTKKNLTADHTMSTYEDLSTTTITTTVPTTSPPGLFLHECAPRLQAIDGLGPKAIQSLLEYAALPRSVALVQGLLQYVSFASQQVPHVQQVQQVQQVGGMPQQQNPQVLDSKVASMNELISSIESAQPEVASKEAVSSTVLTGRVAVFTGKLESGMSRDAAQALFESLGKYLCYFFVI